MWSVLKSLSDLVGKVKVLRTVIKMGQRKRRLGSSAVHTQSSEDILTKNVSLAWLSVEYTEETLYNHFCLFDQDRNGVISAGELRYVMEVLGENLSEEEAEEMLKVADKNGDGEVDFEDFKACMSELLQQCETIAVNSVLTDQLLYSF